MSQTCRFCYQVTHRACQSDTEAGTCPRLQRPAKEQRLFIGVFPAGIGYADRTVERHGDYKRLGFLGFSDLALQIEKDCPAALRAEITEHAAAIQARRGEQYQVSTSGQTITLGYALRGEAAR